jgi:hypothetical protein
LRGLSSSQVLLGLHSTARDSLTQCRVVEFVPACISLRESGEIDVGGVDTTEVARDRSPVRACARASICPQDRP